MKKNRIFRRMIALFLILLTAGAVIPISADAAGVQIITDAGDKERYVSEFNTAVNALKNDRPGMTIRATGQLVQTDTDSTASAWIGSIVQNVFEKEETLAGAVVKKLTEDPSTGETVRAEETFRTGTDASDIIPVAGKSYVSALSSTATFVNTDGKTKSFVMKVLRSESAGTTEILLQFPDCTLANALKSDMAKVFDLPTSTDIQLTENETYGLIEDGVFTLDNVVCKSAYIDVKYNDKMQLLSYTSHIDYGVTITMFGLLDGVAQTAWRFALALLGYETDGLVINRPVSALVRLINQFTGKGIGDVGTSYVNDYIVNYDIFKMDWTPHYFGDINNDNRVLSDDARTILRAAVKLETLTNESGALFYADLDFDGKITASDARLALRIAVGLEDKFTSLEMRQKQLTDEWNKEDDPDVDTPIVTPDEPEVPEIVIDPNLF